MDLFLQPLFSTSTSLEQRPVRVHFEKPKLFSRACIRANLHEVEDHDPADVVGPPLDASTQRLHQRGVPRLRPHLSAGQQRRGREAGVGGMNWFL